MAYQKNARARYAKGIAEAYFYDVATGNLVYYTNKIQTGSIETSINDGVIEGGLNNQALTYIPDTVRVTGTFEAADFSLDARGLAMGTAVEYNAVVPVMEKITATGTTLTVTGTPAPAYGESATATAYRCYVGNDGVNYQVDPTSKQVVNFVATSGTEYCVQYFATMASAEKLVVPTSWSPMILSATIKIPIYGENGASAGNSNKIGYLYEFITRLQIVGGDDGINGSQTEAATTSLQFTALSYDEEDISCANCADDNSVYGYLVYMPCDGETSAVQQLAIIGDGVTVAQSAEAQIPVYYVMPNGTLVTPNYSDLTYESQETGTASVNTTGSVTGVAAGSTVIDIALKSNPDIKAACPVTVT